MCRKVRSERMVAQSLRMVELAGTLGHPGQPVDLEDSVPAPLDLICSGIHSWNAAAKRASEGQRGPSGERNEARRPHFLQAICSLLIRLTVVTQSPSANTSPNLEPGDPVCAGP